MTNLIVTIISIALVAVAAIMGLYYGGQAYQNAQINATANAIMSEAQQILYAERIWSTNNNQPDISGMGTAGAYGTGMSALVNGKELAEWPSFGGTMGVSASLTNPGPQPFLGTAATISTGTYDHGCYRTGNYFGAFERYIFSYSNGNYVGYTFFPNISNTLPCITITGAFSSSNTDVSQINHPIVKIAKAINASLNQIPTYANLATMPYIGLPVNPTGCTTIYNNPQVYSANYASSENYICTVNNAIVSNYCFLSSVFGSPYPIVCVFGPS